MTPRRIELLGKGHERSQFDCGDVSLNDFLRTHAGQDSRRDISKTYVAVGAESNVVLGYYAISTGSVAFEHLPEELAKRLPKYPIPTVHLGRLAVDRSVQQTGLGTLLLIDALKRVLALAEHVGICGVTVDAKNPKAKRFYKSRGFLSLSDDPLPLFLPMASIRKL